MGGKVHLKLNTGEKPIANKYRGKDEKNFEKRVKKGRKPVISLCHLLFLRGELLGIEKSPQHVRSTEKMLRLVLAFGQV